MFESKYMELLKRYAVLSDPIDPEVDLARSGLDSLNAISLLLDLEEAYEVEFPQTYMNNDTFATPLALWNALQVIIQEESVQARG
ncbi:hypothetical protein BC351_39090 [Paenibacillus ferrarius]|uniref:Carrier domain-containing protein n=1 Tax=Paenibacillus ferrarius TaxID=1469647 RepID=A0A1V4H9V8_9BACL|nr:phosphopantetheine-binding protein [Paenibacillus ferrarius]OPH47996.1 hypothetical protein BC351_39090 [Paenibacillus ferrarius]